MLAETEKGAPAQTKRQRRTKTSLIAPVYTPDVMYCHAMYGTKSLPLFYMRLRSQDVLVGPVQHMVLQIRERHGCSVHPSTRIHTQKAKETRATFYTNDT